MIDGGGLVGVPHDAILLAFADAALAFDAARMATARDAVLAALGHDAMLDAAAVVGGFNGITRLADATGIPLEDGRAEASAGWRADLGIDEFRATKS